MLTACRSRLADPAGRAQANPSAQRSNYKQPGRKGTYRLGVRISGLLVRFGRRHCINMSQQAHGDYCALFDGTGRIRLTAVGCHSRSCATYVKFPECAAKPRNLRISIVMFEDGLTS